MLARWMSRRYASPEPWPMDIAPVMSSLFRSSPDISMPSSSENAFQSAGPMTSSFLRPSSLKPRACRVLKYGMSLGCSPNSAPARDAASFTAFRVKDRKAISYGAMPRENASRMISIRVCVLPQPGGPRIKVLLVMILPYALFASASRPAMQPRIHLREKPAFGCERIILAAEANRGRELPLFDPLVNDSF